MLAPYLEHIADAALYLAAAPSVTGPTLTIDGGIMLRRPPHPEDLAAAAHDGLR